MEGIYISNGSKVYLDTQIIFLAVAKWVDLNISSHIR